VKGICVPRGGAGSRTASGFPIAILAILLAAEWACVGPQTQAKGPDQTGPADQPGLFTLPQEQLAHVRVAPVIRRNWPVDVRTTGTVDWDADRTSQAITQVNGPISRILVDMGTPVKGGDPLLYVASPDVANAVAAYRKARNQEKLAQRVLNRSKELLDRGAIAGKDYESAEAALNDASTDVANGLQALRIFGITGEEIDEAEKQGTPISTELAVRAPISGVIVQKLVSPGQLIQAGTTVCFMISDVSSVWVQGHIFDRDLPNVKVGDPVEEDNASFGGRFLGTVEYVGAFVDPATRTTPVRIVTRNPRGLLKKDMFVDAVIRTRSENNVMTVPVSAVLRDDKNEPMVYVQAAPGKFARRPVTLGPQQDGVVAIAAGLTDRDQVVTDGSLFIQFASSIQ
jgi:cobalt-zinc-cadmium efflux system membrane fusion protein